MARDDIQMNIRIPATLRELLERAARTAGRSLTVEIVHRLESSFPEHIETALLLRRQEEKALIERQMEEAERLLDRLEQTPEDKAAIEAATAQFLALDRYRDLIERDCELLESNIEKQRAQIAPSLRKRA